MSSQSEYIPACLRKIPIAARDRAILEQHVGSVVADIDPKAPGEALLVEPHKPPPRPLRTLPFWSKYSADLVFPDRQLWVAPAYGRYRWAWEKVFGAINDADSVLDHLHNRKLATRQGVYGLLRLHRLPRAVNTSGGRGLEQSGKDYADHMDEHKVAPPNDPIDYAGPFGWAKMAHVIPGGVGAPEGIEIMWHEMRGTFQDRCLKADKCECG